MEKIDVNEYYMSVSSHLEPIKDIFLMVFKKQRKDLLIGDISDPSDVELLIERVSKAIEFFAGKNTKETVRKIMKKQLRQMAPEYYRTRYGF